MRLLVDECTGPKVAQWLREQGHEVFSVYEEARGMKDDDIIQKAFAEGWILVTNDKDFGDKIYRERRSHRGIIFMRLEDESAANKIDVLRLLFENYANKLSNNVVVVTETHVRFART